jgi:hypothetical protein
MTTATTTKKPAPTPHSLHALAAEARAAMLAAQDAERKLVAAGMELLRRVGTAAALTRSDRRGRTSAASHIARLLELGGTVDLEKFERALAERPHLWPATQRALHRIEHEHIIGGWWRNGFPIEEDQLRRAVVGYSQDDDHALAAECSRAGFNAYHVSALAFQRAAAARPDLFGTLTRSEESEEIAEALDLIQTAGEVIRSSPTMLAALCEEYGVRRRVGVDPLPDLIDAAAARAPR